MRSFPRSLAALLLLPLVLTAPAPAGGDDASAETAWGLHTRTFDTLHGRVVVTVADDAAAGDTLSGRVRLEPAGDDEATRSANLEALRGYSVATEDSETPLSQDILRWVVPATATAVPLVLRGPDGAPAGQTSVPVASSPGAAPTTVELPPVAQSGRPVAIAGRFDGDLSTSRVALGGRMVTVLAESPRRLVVEVPSGPSGPTDIEVTEGGETTRGTVRVLGLSLSAPDVDLARGERTTLSVQVTGLDGLDEPIPLTVVNRSPDRVRLAGGDEQVITIEPSGVTGDDHTWTATLTGVAPGAFEISAYVPWLRNPGPGPVFQPRPCRCTGITVTDRTRDGLKKTLWYRELETNGRVTGLVFTAVRHFDVTLACGNGAGTCQSNVMWQLVGAEVEIEGVKLKDPAADAALGANDRRRTLAAAVRPTVGYLAAAGGDRTVRDIASGLGLEAECGGTDVERRQRVAARVTVTLPAMWRTDARRANDKDVTLELEATVRARWQHSDCPPNPPWRNADATPYEVADDDPEFEGAD
jgi:hypothetical protein